MKRLQDFATDLQKTYSEAYNQQIQAILTTNERLADSLQEFSHCRQSHDLVAAETNVLATLFEGVSLQAKTLFEQTQKIEDCYAAIARDSIPHVSKKSGVALVSPVAGAKAAMESHPNAE